MLSRTAENLYWLARYVERAEYIARTIDATLRVTALPAAYIGKTNEWESALLTAGVSNSFFARYNDANETNALCTSESCGHSGAGLNPLNSRATLLSNSITRPVRITNP